MSNQRRFIAWTEAKKFHEYRSALPFWIIENSYTSHKADDKISSVLWHRHETLFTQAKSSTQVPWFGRSGKTFQKNHRLSYLNQIIHDDGHSSCIPVCSHAYFIFKPPSGNKVPGLALIAAQATCFVPPADTCEIWRYHSVLWTQTLQENLDCSSLLNAPAPTLY